MVPENGILSVCMCVFPSNMQLTSTPLRQEEGEGEGEEGAKLIR